MKRVIAIVLTLCAGVAAAQTVAGSDKSENLLLTKELCKYQGMVPTTWQFFIVPANRWSYAAKLAKANTDKAFTELRFGRTWINANELRPDYRNEFTRIVANEVAHIFCDDTNESRADGAETFHVLKGLHDKQTVCR